MSGFTIDISGDLGEKLKNMTIEVKNIIDDELYAFGLETVADAKTLCPVDEGFLRNSITFDKKELLVEIIVAANYAAYVEFGTRAFAASLVSLLPPEWQAFAASFQGSTGGSFKELVMRITEWVKRKGIDEHLAYPIALKIVRYGSRAKPFLFPAIEVNKQKLIENLQRQLNAG